MLISFRLWQTLQHSQHLNACARSYFGQYTAAQTSCAQKRRLVKLCMVTFEKKPLACFNVAAGLAVKQLGEGFKFKTLNQNSFNFVLIQKLVCRKWGLVFKAWKRDTLMKLYWKVLRILCYKEGCGEISKICSGMQALHFLWSFWDHQFIACGPEEHVRTESTRVHVYGLKTNVRSYHIRQAVESAASWYK